MKRVLILPVLAFLLPLSAFEWKLPDEAWTMIDPSGVWSFHSTPRKGIPADWKVLSQKDFNPIANRLMFSVDDGNVWGVPSVRLLQFSLPGEQVLEMHTGPSADPVIVFSCTAGGELEYELTVTDPAPADGPGADGNALFLTGRISGNQEEVLERFTFRNRQGETHKKSLAVKAGDRIFFRKSASLADDFGRRVCRVTIRIRLKPESGSTGLNALLMPAGRILFGESVPLDEIQGGFRGDKALPYASIRKSGEGEFEITARAEKNSASSSGCGDIVLCWNVPANGSYRVSLQAENPGLDVKGGDGGRAGLYYLPPESILFGSPLLDLRLPASRKESVAPKSGEVVLKLKAGDRLGLRFHAGTDGYGDLFKVRLNIRPAENGIVPEAPAVDGVLPKVASQARPAGAPPRPGLFWLGTNGDWLNGSYAVRSLELIRKFIPELAVIGVGGRPDLWPDNPYLREQKIPSLVQSFGSGYEPFWRYRGAFEHDHNGVCHAEQSFVALSGMAHAVALPHPAAKEAFDRLARASVRSGYSGYGFNDMVWHWGPGRGASGYSPETVKAFIRSLKGEDEGFMLNWGGNSPEKWYFRDYVKYYLGFEPRPEFIKLKSWDEYRPLWRQEQEQKRTRGEDITAEMMLFDLLVHYEWLKAADCIGKAVKEEGGVFQVLPNPEDLANGCDFLFLAGLSNVYLKTEEYFQSPLVMNGVYYRFPYFKQRTAKGTETGIVLEGGGGGNGVPYYTAETSLKMAYEATLAAESDHLEADFWPSHQMALEETAKMETVRNRYGAILAYGLGFKYAREDALFRRPAPQFISITSRRLFRPWGAAYRPWSWYLNTEYSPDQLLARMGYVFAGQGEEVLQEPDFQADTVFFSANPATVTGWRSFMAHLESGRVKNGIVMADAMRTRIGEDMRPVSFAPESFKPEITVGGKVLAGSRKVGKGTLYCLFITPVPEKIGAAVPDEETGKMVYRRLLDSLGIQPNWESSSPVEARLYQGGDGAMLLSAMRHDVLRKQVDGLYPESASDDSSIKVKLVSGKRYEAITFPELRRTAVVAGDDGMAELPLGRSAYELIFLQPEGAEFYRRLEKRAEEFHRAMTLDGIAASPMALPQRQMKAPSSAEPRSR